MYECANCGSAEDLHIHHIVPRGLGGTERSTNKVILCCPCHALVHGWSSGYAAAWKAGMERIKSGNPKPPSFGTPTKRTPEVLAEIKRAIVAGEKADSIAARLGISLFTFRAARKELGFPPLPPGRRPSTVKLSDWKRRTPEQRKYRTARQEAKRKLKRQKQYQLFEITG